MNFSAPFIARPVATMLLAIGILLAGGLAYRFLPVAPLPSVDIPTIVVFAGRPGADPETMANSVAAPLERRLGEIAGVTELTSLSAVGSTSVIVQFDVGKNLESAAYDVQAAINAALPDLPAELPQRPYYKKFNPAEAPILTLALTSPTLSVAQVYDAADTILAQRLSQADGVSQVQVGGGEKPAVRVQLDPAALVAASISGDNVVATVRAANVNAPTGGFQGPRRAEIIGINGQLSHAADYAPLLVKSANSATLRLDDVARVVDDVANTRLAAWVGKEPAILLTITKEAGANIIDTVNNVKALLPQLMEWLPRDIAVSVIADRTTTIRASVGDVQLTLLMTVALVLIVVALFMRRLVPTVAAAVTIPLSLAGTLAAMWLFGYSLDNFSLMALTVSVGFVVDDAIVMIENIVRLIERGRPPLAAAIEGARQIGFTVVSISVSLVAVFIPILFMGGILGRLFHEFAVTLTMAIAISALVSLTLTPMICGRFMRASDTLSPTQSAGPVGRAMDRAFGATTRVYVHTLDWALRHRRAMLGLTVATVGATVWLYGAVPKGFLPTQDTGLLIGSTLASPDVSFQAMAERQREVVDVLLADPAVESVGSTIGVTTGWSSLNRGQLSISLKPLAERRISSEQVINRLRGPLAKVGGVQTTLFSAQDLRGGGRSGGAQFQFVLLADTLPELRQWSLRLEDKLKTLPQITDVTSDQDRAGPQADVVIDRETAARLGVSVQAIDDALNNAYSQRQISVIYTQRNQYRVVVEIDPRLAADPSQLDHIYVGASNGTQVRLGSVAHFGRSTAPLTVRHQGQFPAATLSFNLAPGVALGDAIALVKKTTGELGLPPNIRTDFAGNAKFLTDSLKSQPFLILAALVSMYIILGVLYESLIQPLTILSTLPSAGIGALVALLLTGTDLSVMAIIGILLLMGIVKKNAIMLIDFALEAERHEGLTPDQAIRAACSERFRPIIMTTLAALLGALPLAFAFGTGAELRTPLGISIIGGLILSQLLTLYTTPVVFLALERFTRRRPRLAPAHA